MTVDKFLEGVLLYVIFILVAAITFVVGAGIWFLIAAVI